MSSNQNSRIKNLSQERAAFAYDEIKRACDQLQVKERKKEFKSHVKDVPMMIRSNGLAAAYAFVYSKVKENGDEKNDYKLIEEISRRWLVQQGVMNGQQSATFYKTLTQMEREPYRRAIRELLALFTWLKRFADGMIDN